MQVMVLDQDQNLQVQLAGALMQKGFHVICVESIGAAENFIRRDFIDVLVMGERVGGKLSHSLALLAECRNPLVSAILLTDRTGPGLEEIFDLIPSIYGILGRKISADIVAQVVLASTIGQTAETIPDRLANRWAAAAGDEVDWTADIEEAHDLSEAMFDDQDQEPLPLLVLTDPQKAEPAFDLAGWDPVMGTDDLSQIAAPDDDFVTDHAALDDLRGSITVAEQPAESRAMNAFAPGLPQNGNRSPFYRAMADLPFFANVPDGSHPVDHTARAPKVHTSRPMTPRATRPMTPAEMADRRMHLA